MPLAMAAPCSLTVVILTRDEERHIARAVQSVAPIAERIVVVDSGSTDATRDIARAHGAEVLERRQWLNQADQLQWALDTAAIDTAWTMRLDADEWIGADLVTVLGRMLPDLGPDIAGISLDRRHYFMGRWIRHGGRYPLRLLRIWRTGMGRVEQRWMDEHIVLTKGRIAHAAGTFVDQNEHGLTHFTAKHNAYATREAVDALIEKYALFESSEHLLTGSTAQAMRVRAHKTGWYNRLPTGVGPLAYFLYRYILQLGMLDGRAGLIYHGLQGLWYRFLVDAKRVELEQALAGASARDDRIDLLEKMTGLALRHFYGGRSVMSS